MLIRLAPALALGSVIALLALGNFVSNDKKVAARPAGCTLYASSPRLYFCSDRRAYIVEHGVWQNIGPLTPMPGVPVR